MPKKIIIGLLAGVVSLVAMLLASTPASAAVHTVTESCATDVPPMCDFTETRAAGHYQFESDGLHVWTDDASSQAKVAGYVPVSTTLGSVAAGAAPAMDYTVTTGIEPGKQLVIKTAANKTAILVGETVYGDKWWMSDSFCTTIGCDTLGIAWAGGGGSAHSATLAQWSEKLPGATVLSVGFSLGSGVHASGILKSLSLAGDVYRFRKAAVTTTTTTPPATSTSVTPPPSTPVTPPTATTTLQGGTGGPGGTGGSATVNNPGQVSVVPNTDKGIKTGDGSLG